MMNEINADQVLEWDFDRLALDLATTFKNEPPALEFVLPGLLLKSVGVLVSPGGLGKSMMLLQNAISIALGRDVFYLWSEDGTTQIAPGRVIIMAVEDPKEILEHRMYLLGQDLTEEERRIVASRVEIVPGFGLGFSILEERDKGLYEAKAIQRLKDWIQEGQEGPRLVAFDTLNRCLGGAGENSSTDMGQLMTVTESFCKLVGCSALLVHHANKSSGQSGSGQTQFAARGSSAITDNCRWQMNLSYISDKNAASLGIIDTNLRRRLVQVDIPKLNYGPPMSSIILFRGKGGILRNFDREKIEEHYEPQLPMIEFMDDDFGLGQ